MARARWAWAATLSYRPGPGQLAVVERCGPIDRPQQRRLVDLDEATGSVRARPLVVPAWVTGVGGLHFDASGTRAIYSLSRDLSSSTWAYHEGAPVKLGDGYGAPAW